MTSRALTWTIAVSSSILGVTMIVVTIGVATDAVPERQTVIAESMPRPPFALDDRLRTEPGRIGQHDVAQISRDELAFMQNLTSRAAAIFGVPEALLAHEVGRATLAHRDGTEHRLEPLRADVIRDLNVPTDGETRKATERLVAFLGRDPRPFDSYLSRETELGVAARAAHLSARHAGLAEHLEGHGIIAAQETLWFLALVVAKRGDREIVAALEEALDLGPERLGRAFADLEPTVGLLTDEPFVFRAFLRVWIERDAREHTQAFMDDVKRLARVFRMRTPGAGAPGTQSRVG